jgi:hypothetical protein
MEEVKFYVRCYDKIELARMYFPNLSNPVSVAKLRRWMRNCMPLMEELMAGENENVQCAGSQAYRTLFGGTGRIRFHA